MTGFYFEVKNIRTIANDQLKKILGKEKTQWTQQIFKLMPMLLSCSYHFNYVYKWAQEVFNGMTYNTNMESIHCCSSSLGTSSETTSYRQ